MLKLRVAKTIFATCSVAEDIFLIIAQGSAGLAAMSVLLIVYGVSFPPLIALGAAAVAPSSYGLFVYFQGRRASFFDLIKKIEAKNAMARQEALDNEWVAKLYFEKPKSA